MLGSSGSMGGVMLQHNNKIDPRHFHADPDNKNKVNKAAPRLPHVKSDQKCCIYQCSSSVRILINLMDPDPC